MDTLHKRLAEIRDLRAEELDLVGGGEGGTYYENRANTYSYAAGSQYPQQIDDVQTQSVQYDS